MCIKASVRRVITLTLVFIFSTVLSPAAHSQDKSPISLVGARAAYNVTSTTKALDGSVDTQSQHIDNTVTAQQSGTLTVHSVVVGGGPIQQIDYQVPLQAVIRPVPGQWTQNAGRVSFTETHNLALPDGRAVTLSQTGETDSIWFRKVLVTVTGQQMPEFTLQVELAQTSGPIAGNVTGNLGEAFWLLPNLMAPSEGVQVLQATPIRVTPSVREPPIESSVAITGPPNK